MLLEKGCTYRGRPNVKTAKALRLGPLYKKKINLERTI